MNKFIDLKKHYNERMIYPKDTPLSLDGIFDHMYFPLEDFAEYDTPVKFENVEFMLSNNSASHDCVQCFGQTVEVLGATGNLLYVLGFSVWGRFQDIFTIKYENGMKEELKVHLCDIGIDYESQFFFDEINKENEGVGIIFKKAILFNRFLNCYSFKCKLSVKSPIQSIKFPQNEFMYVFAITIKG